MNSTSRLLPGSHIGAQINESSFLFQELAQQVTGLSKIRFLQPLRQLLSVGKSPPSAGVRCIRHIDQQQQQKKKETKKKKKEPKGLKSTGSC